MPGSVPVSGVSETQLPRPAWLEDEPAYRTRYAPHALPPWKERPLLLRRKGVFGRVRALSVCLRFASFFREFSYGPALNEVYAFANPLINRAGDVASGDGMRFVFPVRSVHSSPDPKYFNRDQGITRYNLLSNAPASIPCPTEPPDSPNLRTMPLISRRCQETTPHGEP